MTTVNSVLFSLDDRFKETIVDTVVVPMMDAVSQHNYKELLHYKENKPTIITNLNDIVRERKTEIQHVLRNSIVFKELQKDPFVVISGSFVSFHLRTKNYERIELSDYNKPQPEDDEYSQTLKTLYPRDIDVYSSNQQSTLYNLRMLEVKNPDKITIKKYNQQILQIVENGIELEFQYILPEFTNFNKEVLGTFDSDLVRAGYVPHTNNFIIHKRFYNAVCMGVFDLTNKRKEAIIQQRNARTINRAKEWYGGITLVGENTQLMFNTSAYSKKISAKVHMSMKEVTVDDLYAPQKSIPIYTYLEYFTNCAECVLCKNLFERKNEELLREIESLTPHVKDAIQGFNMCLSCLSKASTFVTKYPTKYKNTHIVNGGEMKNTYVKTTDEEYLTDCFNGVFTNIYHVHVSSEDDDNTYEELESYTQVVSDYEKQYLMTYIFDDMNENTSHILNKIFTYDVTVFDLYDRTLQYNIQHKPIITNLRNLKYTYLTSYNILECVDLIKKIKGRDSQKYMYELYAKKIKNIPSRFTEYLNILFNHKKKIDKQMKSTKTPHRMYFLNYYSHRENHMLNHILKPCVDYIKSHTEQIKRLNICFYIVNVDIYDMNKRPMLVHSVIKYLAEQPYIAGLSTINVTDCIISTKSKTDTIKDTITDVVENTESVDS